MALHYSPRSVLRHLPLPLIRAFMAHEGITPDALARPAWDALVEGDTGALHDAWRKLPPDRREPFEQMMRQVHELASEAGTRQMIAEGPHHRVELADTLAGIDGFHAKAPWVYTYHRHVFHTARQLLAAGCPMGRFWNLTTGFDDVPFDATPGALTNLRQAVAFLYREQGRGHQCSIEQYERDGALYVFLFVDDYTHTHTAHDVRGTLTRTPLRPTFEVVYVYTPSGVAPNGVGTLDLYARGDRRWRAELRERFCEHVLHTRAPLADPARRSYHLNGLIDHSFPLTTDPARGVLSAVIRKMRVVAREDMTRRVVLEANAARTGDVYEMLDIHFPVERFPRDELLVSMVTFTIMHTPPDGDRARPLTFDVSFPDACNLKSLSPAHREVGEWCLRQWGILGDDEPGDYGGEDDGTDGGPAGAHRAA
ncbi:hypothetical protein R5W24_001790 [Gemmata sp. JC717]|uniref:hypothetical protein n=1 Tax=Gemmata algarum TaxID=2975278 RepID=UPI0021BAB3C6|nr:hypothetical protein [Gemmata algarum]MDY3552703.1 hypothetical protein [Gemmata algarum]